MNVETQKQRLVADIASYSAILDGRGIPRFEYSDDVSI